MARLVVCVAVSLALMCGQAFSVSTVDMASTFFTSEGLMTSEVAMTSEGVMTTEDMEVSKVTTAESTSATTGATPSPTPTTAPPPDEGPQPRFWSVRKENDGPYCVLANMGVRLNFAYPKADGEVGETHVDIPYEDGQTNLTGSMCHETNDDLDILKINFLTWNYQMWFRYNVETGLWRVNDIAVVFDVNEEFFPNADDSIEGNSYVFALNNVTVFQTPDNEAAFCFNEQLEDRFQAVDNITLSVTTVQLKLMGHLEQTSEQFRAPNPCSADTDIDLAAPITIASVLVAVVAATLVFYFFRRAAANKN